MHVVILESSLNPLLDNAKISIFSKVDKMYLLLYWVTYVQQRTQTQLIERYNSATRTGPHNTDAGNFQLMIVQLQIGS